eukprot:GDKJ01003212.1.p1 GENE.GDKJ01003212.1~~GDKJ01003212.1.p1  ORF type:complete len:561 (+),score=167.19 GDKJ01003212.1:46-1728(+)
MSIAPQIILLKEGTDTSQGKAQIISNVNACQIVADIVKTTLGPRGMDKLIHQGQNVTVTNDGATVMKLLNVVHPAARILVDIAKSQDDEVGDGTTSVVVLAGEMLREAKQFLEDGMHPQIIIKGYRKAGQLALEKLNDLKIDLSAHSPEEKRNLLRKCAETTLNSKLISGQKEFFSEMIVDAITFLGDNPERDMLGLKKVAGGSVLESQLVNGVAFKKTFSYAGFEQQPKRFSDAKILLLNLELELKAEKENAEVRIENPTTYQSIVDAEWRIIYEKLESIVASGANVVLSRQPVGDLATQYFADRNIFCAGRVEDADIRRTAKATGAKIQTTVHNLDTSVMGSCGLFEEVQLGAERFNFFRDCHGTKSATMILRGGAQQFLEEAHRSVHDAIEIVRRAAKSNTVVGGAGAIEMELSRHLRECAKAIPGKLQLVIAAYARALEIIPRCLSQNSGFDATDILNGLRQVHAQGLVENRWMGVDCMNGGMCDAFTNFIWEPALVRRNAIASATEAACLVLSVDETVRNPRAENPNAGMPAPSRGGMRGRGRGGARVLKGMGGK